MTEKPAQKQGSRRGSWRQLGEEMKAMALYGRFEHLVSVALTFIISAIILVALLRLVWEVALLLLFQSLDPLDRSIFQPIFGSIMTLLIAMEFKHSILTVTQREHHIIQARTVILIALLAMARKFIILDAGTLDGGKIAALAAALLALGVVYRLLREREE